MEQFIRASQTALGDERARFLTPEEARKNLNRPVCFVRGKYAGITGTLQRISHNKVVVLDLQGLVSLALPIGHVAEVEIPQVIKEPSPDSLERDHLQPAVGIPERDQAL